MGGTSGLLGGGFGLPGYRGFGTKTDGGKWSDGTLVQVWVKGREVEGYHPAMFRLDACGALIRWDKYGDTTENGHGWEVDHIVPVAAGGTDDISNLQPLQWQNNRKKSDGPWDPLACQAVHWKG